MTCRELVAFLMEYLSGDLPNTDRATFEEHLAECDACVAYLESYKETVRLGKAAFMDLDDPVPDEVPEELVHAILSIRA
jgi:anti-sigma factor RsiW